MLPIKVIRNLKRINIFLLKRSHCAYFSLVIAGAGPISKSVGDLCEDMRCTPLSALLISKMQCRLKIIIYYLLLTLELDLNVKLLKIKLEI